MRRNLLHLAWSIAAGATAFYQSRRKAGFAVADFAEAGSEIWLRMFRDEVAYEELKDSVPLYAGDSDAPDQGAFRRLQDPADWDLFDALKSVAR